MLLNDAEAWLKGSAKLTEADQAFQQDGTTTLGGLEAEMPHASLESLDIKAQHDQFRSDHVEADRGGPATQRTVAARAELTALTPSVERFFGTRGGEATRGADAASLPALARLANAVDLKEEERAVLLSLAQKTMEQPHVANK